LAEYFLARANARCNRRVMGISPEAASRIVHYDWPGNIRELENAIERAVVLGLTDMIVLEDLPQPLLDGAPPNTCKGGSGFHDAVRENKIRIIQSALEECGGSHIEAAKLLGLNRTYLHRLIRTLGM